MSYDFSLLRIQEGSDVVLAYQQQAEEEERLASDLDATAPEYLDEKIRAEMQRLAMLIRSARPQFVEFQPERPLPWIELNDHQLEVRVSIGPRSIGIELPYFKQDAAAKADAIRQVILALEPEGFITFDPQLERVIHPGDFDEVVGTYRSMDRILPELKAGAPRKPWWKFW